VSEQPRFRADLYRGTSADYDRFRLRYPSALIEDLCRRTALTGTGRLLDLACGPGTVTFALCDRFAEVCAVDLEPDAIDFASATSATLGVQNVQWRVGRAEDVDVDTTFELVTIGNAFHRLDRGRVAGRAGEWLGPGGHLALLWSSTPTNGPAPWQGELADTVVEWMDRVGAQDRLPADLEEHLRRHPHVRVLEDAGLVVVGHREFVERHDWNAESLIGFMYSTSLLSRVAVGDRIGEFEQDVRRRLRKIDPTDVYTEEVSFAYDLARRPTDS
jgi:SAM-dependent methyltransferase